MLLGCLKKSIEECFDIIKEIEKHYQDLDRNPTSFSLSGLMDDLAKMCEPTRLEDPQFADGGQCYTYSDDRVTGTVVES